MNTGTTWGIGPELRSVSQLIPSEPVGYLGQILAKALSVKDFFSGQWFRDLGGGKKGAEGSAPGSWELLVQSRSATTL